MLATPIRSSSAALVLLCFAAPVVFGAEVTLSGVSQACFGFQCTPAIVNTVEGLTYYGSTFEGRTDEGFLAFGGEGGDNVQNTQNFGLISTGVSMVKYSTLPFTLVLDFSFPSDIDSNPLHFNILC